MAMSTGIDDAVGGAADTREARLERLAAELYANDPQVGRARPRDEISAALRRPGIRLAQMVKTVMEGYADRPALGHRAYELTPDTTGRTTRRLLPRFDTITYRDLWQRVGAVASEWHHDPAHPLSAGDFICTLGFTSTDYTTVNLACIHLGAVSVPLQTSAPVAQHIPIIAETHPRIIAVGIDHLGDAVEAVLTGYPPERLIVFDYEARDDDQRDTFEAARRRVADAGSPVVIDTLHAVLDRGRALPPAPLHVDDEDNPLVSIFYTSGSTGTPKGAMYPERTSAAVWTKPADAPMITLSYMPMSHLAGYSSLIGTLASGGTCYFAAKSDMSTLFDDITLVRPTAFLLIPRVCEMLFHHYLGELDRREADGVAAAAVEQEVKADLRQNFLGGRVLTASTGTAPLSAELRAFIESLLDQHLVDGYGSTEAGRVLIDNQLQRPPVIDYKLVDVPELGYFVTDKPHPRGELLIKSEQLMPGYYKRPDVTAEVFDEDGFYKTGDIMAEIGPDQLLYVDRRNNVLKLAQGEFVAASHLEAVFGTSPLVRQIYIYGSSERSFLLAVVVPAPGLIEQLRREGGRERVKSAIGESLQHIAAEAHLNGYEIPRDFLIETEPFSLENGLLSGARKLLRPRLKAHYGERLEQIYADIAAGQVNELRALRTQGSDRPVLDTVTRAVQATLGLSPAELSVDARFIDLGGDSLSALSFSKLLEDIFGIEVPVGVVINPAGDLQQLANYIETRRSSAAKRPTFATVHGRDSSEVYASDLTLDKFIDTKTLEASKTLPRPNGAVDTVLLTGATGYLGRFLCLEWLERLAPAGGTLICIARGSDAAAARRRIEEAIDSGDAELSRRFRELADQHMEVLAGDIGEPNLGLDEATWNRLADGVDLIVHPAAHVNHVLPYSQLFGANVLGTAELIRMALTSKLKPFNDVSTVAAAMLGEHDAIDENADIRIVSPVRKIDDTYASGYATSKWAGEVLVREAHDLCGLPIAVFRSDMILAHSRYAGQLNVPDMFTRLLLSVVATGVAPRSFYRTEDGQDRPRAHYDGLPADFTAEAIAELGAQATDGYRTYNVVNTHDDGVSLDQFVDWLIDAGHPIQRIDDYDEWLTRFETAMRALPDRQRQHSLLPLLDAVKRPDEPVRGSAIPAERFRAGVQRSAIGPDRDIPHLSSSLIEKYVADLQHLGLL